MRPWTPREKQILKELYPTHQNSELSGILGRSPSAIQHKASDLGLIKDPEIRGIRGANILEVIKQRQIAAGFIEE